MSHGNGGNEGSQQGGQGGQGSQTGQGSATPGQGQPAGGQGSQGGQGQPAGGQGQPQGDQGQPQGGQGQPGGYQQPQGGPAGGPAAQESIGDLFSNPATLAQLQTIVALYGVLAVTLGIAGATLVNQFSAFGATTIIAGGAFAFAMLVGVVVAALLGVRAGSALLGERDQLVYATVGISTLAGNMGLVVLTVLLSSLGGSVGLSFVRVFVVAIVGSVMAAAAGLGGAFAGLTFTSGSNQSP